jgi:WXG100 protein secretion system (Wss), protein YukD
MAGIRITITDVTGQYLVEVPPDVTVEKLLKVLPSRLGRPTIDPSGYPATYRLYHDGTELPAEASLEESGIRDNDTLTLAP